MSENSGTRRRRDQKDKQRVQNAAQNGIDPSFFRWAVQSDSHHRRSASPFEPEKDHQRPAPPSSQKTKQLPMDKRSDAKVDKTIQKEDTVTGKQKPETYDLSEDDDEAPNAKQQGSKEYFRQEALKYFEPGVWLEDTGINLLLEAFARRSPQFGLLQTYTNLAVTSNLEKPEHLNRLRHRYALLLTKEMFLAPMAHQNHWVLFVCFPSSGQVYVYDSLCNEDYIRTTWQTKMRPVLNALFGQSIVFSNPVMQRIAQQPNGYDCGLHVIRNADLAMRPRGSDLPDPPFESVELRTYYRMMLSQIELTDE